MDLKNLTIEKTKKSLEKKEISAVELATYYNEKIAKSQSHAFITPTPELALASAQKSDENIKNGTARLLEGIPIAVKDLFCTESVRTTAASRMLDNFIPPYESSVTSKLFANGAVMTGKTNLDEFAMGSANITSFYGNVINPWREQNNPQKNLVPGGSSGGSAVAVAEDLSLGSLGTDTGGSIRQPASFCGIVGIKPTYGRCSRFGTVAFASSLDQAGVFAKTVADTALLQQSISGFDKNDSTSVAKDVPNWHLNLNANLSGKKIGVPKEYLSDELNQEIKDIFSKGLEWLKANGAEIIDISLPHTKYALPTYYIVAPAEASSNLSRYDGVRYGYRTKGEFNSLDEMYEMTRDEGFGDEVKRRIMIGTYVLSAGYYDAYYLKAQKMRKLIANDFEQAFSKVDAIFTPTAPSSAFEIGAKQDDPIQMYLNDVFTVPASLAGLPAMSVPAGLDSKGLPLGLQIISKAWDEQTCFNVAKAIEENAGLFVAR